jgi:hypothetical protein
MIGMDRGIYKTNNMGLHREVYTGCNMDIDSGV